MFMKKLLFLIVGNRIKGKTNSIKLTKYKFIQYTYRYVDNVLLFSFLILYFITSIID